MPTTYLWLDGRVRRWKEISKKEWYRKFNSGKFPASHFATVGESAIKRKKSQKKKRKKRKR